MLTVEAHRTGGITSCDPSPLQIDKPESHRRRSYEFVRLSNGLQVMLVSDSACDKAAAALCVGVGRLHEPKDLPGLAHFCEHMLFLGTEGFPDEAEYKRFVKKHGGMCNASTGDAQTCYAFDIMPAHLRGALDRFSQFFLAPLFTPSATVREIQAVDSEHSMRITDDGRRSYATLLLDANPAHPLHWGSGNAESLRDRPLERGVDTHAEVMRFYTENYSAADMTLAVLGREPLTELRDVVESRFSGVRNTGRRALRGEEHGGLEPPVLAKDFAGLVLRVPSKDVREVAFSWQLPCWQVPQWRTKPTGYASHLIGHEGNGSLLSALKARGWATSLYAGASEYGCFSHFEVSMNLTEEGLDHVEDIGALLFAFIRLLRRTPVLPWVLEEMQQLPEARFRYADDVQPYGLVNTLAQNLQYFPPKEVLSAPAKLFLMDKEAAASVPECLTVDSVRVELAAKRFGERCNLRDPWYGGQYCKLPLQEEWQRAWSRASGGTGEEDAVSDASSHGIRLPDPNPFMPKDLSIRNLPAQAHPLPVELSRSRGGPGWPLARCFHRQDDRFGQPKAIVAFRLYSAPAAADARGYLLAQMWCNAVMEELNEYAYDATTAGLHYSLNAFPGGLEVSVSGFSDKLPLLLRAVAKKMREETRLAPGTFALVRDRYERFLRNRARKQRPCDQASRRVRELRYSLAFPPEDQLAVLQTLSETDFEGENQALLDSCHVEALLMGNLQDEDALSAAGAMIEELHLQQGTGQLPWRAEAALPSGYTLWRVNGTDAEDRNNCVRCELQLPISLENSVLVSILVRVLSPRFFEELRTKQQLGYIVQMSWSEHEGFLGIVCTVQTEYSPEFVRSRIDTFIREHLSWLESGLDETEFLHQRDGLVSNLKEAPKSLGEEFGRHWAEVARQRFDFERRERRLKAMEAADLAALHSFVREQVRPAPRLCVEVCSAVSWKTTEAAAGEAELPDRVWDGPEAVAAFRAGAVWTALDTAPPLPASKL